MAAASSSIGLGTLWKVPYITSQRGGGAFFLVYILCIFVVGLPLFIAELLLGKRSQKGAVLSFEELDRKGSSWKIVGWLGVAGSFLIMSYYSVIAGWGMHYLYLSLTGFWKEKSPKEITSTFEAVYQNGTSSVLWHFLFTAICVSIIYRGVRKGIESWTKVATSSLLALLVVFFFISWSFPHFSDTLKFLFSADFSTLSSSAILEALALSFFTLSLGQGIMITYGSYMGKESNIPKTALLVTTMVASVSTLSACSMFPTMFATKVQGGVGIVFQTMPVFFSSLPGESFLSSLFFFLLVGVAIGASVALLEVSVSTLMDICSMSRQKAAFLAGLGTFSLGIPSALSGTSWFQTHWTAHVGKPFLETLDHTVCGLVLPTSGFLVCIFVGRKLSPLIFKNEFAANSRLYVLWTVFLRYIAPAAIAAIFLHTVYA
jgi:NSS family neurotransmitter:Na+ symporter